MSTSLVPVLTPPATKPHASVARVTDAWYVGCQTRDLKRKPLSRTLLGIPLVLFRGDDGKPAALLDRCAHRNVPLSLGKVVGHRLQCAYHGWEFTGEGACEKIPGLCGDPEGKARRVPMYPCLERDGFVWVYAEPDSEPKTQPPSLPNVNEPGYTTVVRSVTVQGTMHATAENALDVPHTAFLHAGLFRGAGEPNLIDVVVRRWHDRVEAEYIGEPRPEGLVGRILSPSGGVVSHFDRFMLPCVAQVEYRLGDELHFLVTSLCTPVEDFVTTMYAVVSFRTRIPGWILKPLVEPLAMQIFKQDAVILKHQTETVHRFGGEQFVSTDIDILGPHIWRLLKAAERKELDPMEEPTERNLTIRV